MVSSMVTLKCHGNDPYVYRCHIINKYIDLNSTAYVYR
jgi:hypothetical protein